MLQRDFRVPATALIGHVIQSVAFFASSTIIVIGALARVEAFHAHRGPGARYTLFAREHPAVPARPAGDLRPRLLQVHLGASAVQLRHHDDRRRPDAAARGGAAPAAGGRDSHSLSLASASFNDGLRNDYFGFAPLTWHVHPLLVPLMLSLIVALLPRRQLSSATASNIALVLADLDLAARPAPGRLRGLL